MQTLHEKNIFQGIQKGYIVIFQTECSCLNRGLSSNLWWLRSANQVSFTEESQMSTEKACLRKNVYKLAKHRLPETKRQPMLGKH